ncbi:pheromone-like peptide [Heterobasidion irregulare TC 32-1]|uniref:Pheromone-like peptide n=1 Tax=Heterobasidion irregulare (strain TC 32-1) TaxID=747525 RepID=W4K1S1_HETIT|nr:pheromone-like peptide [Heterobasidion irregulare TC 32-1]ETW79757.1 pheromone-like peptide [Heterobasidion irregulare TC 32-1]
MDSFITAFFTNTPVEVEPASTTPIDSDNGNSGGSYCVVA